MKNKTARTTMMNKTAGLILVPDDEVGVGEEDNDDDESLWKEALEGYGGEGDEDKRGGE